MARHQFHGNLLPASTSDDDADHNDGEIRWEEENTARKKTSNARTPSQQPEEEIHCNSRSSSKEAILLVAVEVALSCLSLRALEMFHMNLR